MKEWVFTLSKKHKTDLGPIRCLSRWLAAEDEATIWLKGGMANEGVDLRIRQLPIDHSYLLDENLQLFPIGGLTPLGILPSMEWRILTDFIPIEFPIAALPAQPTATYSPQLVAATFEQHCEGILTDWDTWSKYAVNAPRVRLEGLRFAVSGLKAVFILGTPLPPIQGSAYWKDQQLLLPAGWAFQRSMSAQILARKLCPQKDAFLLFHKRGDWESIPESAFVKASRSAVRLTASVLNE